MKINGTEVPDRMTHEEATDLFMSTAVGRSTGATREQVLAKLLDRFPTEDDLAGFIRSAKVQLGEMMADLGEPYTLLLIDHAPAIRCNFCGMTSHHPQDVANRYCGKCQRFHEIRL